LGLNPFGLKIKRGRTLKRLHPPQRYTYLVKRKLASCQG